MKKIIHKKNIKDKEDDNLTYWSGKSSEERLSAVQILREQYILLFNKQEEYNESRRRLRRFYKVVKRPRS